LTAAQQARAEIQEEAEKDNLQHQRQQSEKGAFKSQDKNDKRFLLR